MFSYAPKRGKLLQSHLMGTTCSKKCPKMTEYLCLLKRYPGGCHAYVHTSGNTSLCEMTKIAAVPIYGKKLINCLQNQTSDYLKFGMEHRGL